MSTFERLISRPHLTGAKKQHYVPRFYLAGFAEDNLLSRLDRRSGKITSRTPDHTARIPNLYTFEDHKERRRYDMEVLLAHFEDKAAPIILKMAARERITVDEREQLTAFIAFSALRTPAAIEEAKVVHAGFVKARARLLLSDERKVLHLLHELNGPGADAAKLQKEAASVAQMVRDGAYTVEVDGGVALGKSLRNFDAIAKSIFSRDWMVFHATEGSEGFLTTDQPVVLATTSSADRRAPLGYGSAHAQVLFPLTHSCALVISGNQGCAGHADITPEWLSRFNSTMAAHCYRYLFGRSRQHLQAVAERIQLARKPWKPSHSVGIGRQPGSRSLDVFVLRTGESLLDGV